VTGESHYAEMARDARRKRRQLDGAGTDWIVVRNRLSMHGSRNKQLMTDGLNDSVVPTGAFAQSMAFSNAPFTANFFRAG